MKIIYKEYFRSKESPGPTIKLYERPVLPRSHKETIFFESKHTIWLIESAMSKLNRAVGHD